MPCTTGGFMALCDPSLPTRSGRATGPGQALPSPGRRAGRTAFAAALLGWVLSACGGGGGGNAGEASSAAFTAPASVEAGAAPSAPRADLSPADAPVVALSMPLAWPLAPAMPLPVPQPAPNLAKDSLLAAALAAPDPGVLLLLVPDGQSLTDPRVASWVDAALEEGVRLLALTDSQFMQLGPTANAYAGLILPDSLHTTADDALLDAIRTYTRAGGRTLLVFDFGALLPSGFYPTTGPSRLSDLAGVQYLLYDDLRERTTGLGPVRASRNTLRALLVPPGKSLPYVDPAVATAPVTALAATSAKASMSVASPTTLPTTPPTGAITSTVATAPVAGASASALYLPVSPQDPGGAQGFDPQQYLQLRHTVPRAGTPSAARPAALDFGRTQRLPAIDRPSRLPALRLRQQKAALTSDALETYSGYLLGPLNYPVFVTQGDFAAPGQQPLADSPQFGLVAGVNPFGAGQVLFVNLPLTYLKGRTDALPMHGFLHYFTRTLLNLPHLSPMPNGVAGLTLNWHLDAFEAQAPTQSLVSKKVFNTAGRVFSIDLTAGPDRDTAGDALGWNLAANPVAKKLLRNFQTFGHAVGSHGGWIHNFYGPNASDTNALDSTQQACPNPLTGSDNFLQCLVLNRQAVDTVLGRATRGYSAPEGNNPTWAMTYLENQGVVAAYFAGHTGLGMTRQYRDGVLLNPKLWVLPVTPQGMYATFEEWQTHNVAKEDVAQWYRDLVDFQIAQNTSRMVYAHPFGADIWFDVLDTLFTHAGAQVATGQLAWYTMPRLADFMTTRLQVGWKQSTDAAGATRIDATHPVSLKEMTWRLPKSRYATAPVVLTGTATVVTTDPTHWLVKALRGTRLAFTVR